MVSLVLSGARICCRDCVVVLQEQISTMREQASDSSKLGKPTADRSDRERIETPRGFATDALASEISSSNYLTVYSDALIRAKGST
jgi:hypothetical protein